MDSLCTDCRRHWEQPARGIGYRRGPKQKQQLPEVRGGLLGSTLDPPDGASGALCALGRVKPRPKKSAADLRKR
eukprot:6068773-Pyramimonas_sp.AAC.1